MSPYWVPGPYTRSPALCPNLALSWGRTKGSPPALVGVRIRVRVGPDSPAHLTNPSCPQDSGHAGRGAPWRQAAKHTPGPHVLRPGAWFSLSRDHQCQVNPLPLPFSPAPGPSAAVKKTNTTHPSSEVKENRIHLDLKKQSPHPTTTSTHSCPRPLALFYQPEGQITPSLLCCHACVA